MELREAKERRRLLTIGLVGGAVLVGGLAACQHVKRR